MIPKIPLYADFRNRKLANADGSELTLPSLTLGDKVLFSLHFLDRDSSNSAAEVDLNLRTLRASVGSVMTCPDSGTFTLRINTGAESAPLQPTATIGDVQAAVQALPACASAGAYPLAEVIPGTDNGVWLLRFTAAGEVPIGAGTNKLSPTAFVRVRAFQENGVWWHELRLICAPLVFTGAHERVLPTAPSVREIRKGQNAPPEDSTGGVNEIQALTIPSDFQGTYSLQFVFKQTAILGIQATPADIESALNAMWSDGTTRFNVTVPEDNNAYIEFTGDLQKSGQPLITVTVQSFSDGEVQFYLDLNNAALARALRDAASITLPMELEVEIVDTADDLANPAVPGRIFTLFSSAVTIVREQIFEELAVVPEIDWENPPQPTDYIPFTRDQIFSGLQNYIAVLGDGIKREFTVDHNLGADALGVFIRENASGGRLLTEAEYAVTFETNNQAKITFPDAAPIPAVNSLALLLISPFTVNAFQNHTHTMGQIEGLNDALAAVDQRLATLEAYLPSTNPTASSAANTTFDIKIPAREEVLFYNPTKVDLKALPVRAPYLLPAVHQPLVTALSAQLPPPALNAVWSSASRTLIPGTGRIAATYVGAGGFVASDGRMLYPAFRGASTVSYYPAPFEKTLWEFPINDQQLQVGRTLDVEFGVAAQLLNATSEAQWVVFVEWGTPVDQMDPANEGLNLGDIQWAPTPLVSQRIFVTSLLMTHSFGVRIQRPASGGLTADQMRYGAWSTATAAAPTSTNFILRARLAEFDTKNNVPNATGWLYYAFGGTADVTSDAKATIA